jgi:hypothetical protein
LPLIASKSHLDPAAKASGLSLRELPNLVQTSMLVNEQPCCI